MEPKSTFNPTHAKIGVWVSLIFFGGLALLLDWQDEDFFSGGIWGLILVSLLFITVFISSRRKLAKKEVEEHRRAFAKTNSLTWLLPFAGIAVFIGWLSRVLIDKPDLTEFFLGAGIVFCLGACLIVLYIAYTNKGIFQKR